ncbi:hypothetical protein BJ085DRAFT_34505 [Dimargaris cristalligena]|uniref:Uncharacterized protein n=1 Tax=Dimargaris cristalligena TaxID=215637 RepID=A0A4P9ZUQ8_9FUNG|nr:hypothetical protein BJ085DRAFT_34505 [Dimargaris cristalligena]|eukprot:RKP36330.1 hypothetical protein BJ085DRAFT_34505 [Dimargaris cristalligena]
MAGCGHFPYTGVDNTFESTTWEALAFQSLPVPRQIQAVVPPSPSSSPRHSKQAAHSAVDRDGRVRNPPVPRSTRAVVPPSPPSSPRHPKKVAPSAVDKNSRVKNPPAPRPTRADVPSSPPSSPRRSKQVASSTADKNSRAKNPSVLRPTQADVPSSPPSSPRRSKQAASSTADKNSRAKNPIAPHPIRASPSAKGRTAGQETPANNGRRDSATKASVPQPTRAVGNSVKNQPISTRGSGLKSRQGLPLSEKKPVSTGPLYNLAVGTTRGLPPPPVIPVVNGGGCTKYKATAPSDDEYTLHNCGVAIATLILLTYVIVSLGSYFVSRLMLVGRTGYFRGVASGQDRLLELFKCRSSELDILGAWSLAKAAF